jgi:predicted ATPase
MPNINYIESFSFETNKTHPFPFDIPAVKFAKNINVNNPVTIFIGDNGSGKSTLLETIAMQMRLPVIGGNITADKSFEAAAQLQDCLKIKWINNIRQGFFFRAEDFSNFIYRIEKAQADIDESLAELKEVLNEHAFNMVAGKLNFQKYQMMKSYGENMHAFSHGEAFLKIFQSRINGKGVFILDEPEAALSPIRQLSLISMVLETIKTFRSQFILATHSPIMMGIPGALLYEIKEDAIYQTAYEETEHYRITKAFLDNRQQFLRHLDT